MIDVAIVGAGLTGLSLALRLQAAGVSVVLIEARTRIGGRILTDTAGPTKAEVDLGASWYWPETEPRMAALIASLGLAPLAQPDEGVVLSLPDPNQGPQALDTHHVHGGAHRLSGGMTRLVQALQARLSEGTLQSGLRLEGLRDGDGAIELHVMQERGSLAVASRMTARRVVLTLPPRLISESIRFEPPLPQSTLEAMKAVPTWMAREAKACARFDQAFWRDQGQSGSAFASHPQAVLREVWDASDARGAALAGLSALRPDTRVQFGRSMGLLVSSQLAQLFGLAAQTEPDAVCIQDWAREPLTCSEQDRLDPVGSLPQADPVLRRPHWSGRLLFGGTETARQAAGHMEGALESAARLADLLRPLSRTRDESSPSVDDALAIFGRWVAAQRQASPQHYRQQVHRLLSRPDQDRITQRALLATAEQLYAHALEQLAGLDLYRAHTGASGPSEWTPQVLALFAGFSKALVDEGLAFNAGSCALSNFPDEHRPAADYLRAITADLAAAWREFAWSVNDMLCATELAEN